MLKNLQPCSVTLKISRSSVMLYANRYLKREGEPGATVQKYLASFSTRCTDIPPAFDAILRQVSAGKPERYNQLCKRIEVRALIPAREQFQAKVRQKSWEQLAQHLEFTTELLQQTRELPYFDEWIVHPAMQATVHVLLAEAKRLFQPDRRQTGA